MNLIETTITPHVQGYSRPQQYMSSIRHVIRHTQIKSGDEAKVAAGTH